MNRDEKISMLKRLADEQLEYLGGKKLLEVSLSGEDPKFVFEKDHYQVWNKDLFDGSENFQDYVGATLINVNFQPQGLLCWGFNDGKELNIRFGQ